MQNPFKPLALAITLAFSGTAVAENLTVLHVGDQESWLISAQGNLRNDPSQAISFYGGIDRLATVVANRKAAAPGTVITLNAGDSFLPGPRLNASFVNLATAHPDGGQDFYDAMANRQIGVDATTFGNHEFDLDNIGPIAARFTEVSHDNNNGSKNTYLSVNLDFSVTPELAALETAGKVAPSKIITTALGKKVGIVGATTPLLPGISSPPANIMKNWSAANTEAQNLADMIPLVQTEVDRLRNSEGVTVVIVMSHLQNAQNEINTLVPALKNVDMVISGGGHELMRDVLDPNDRLISGGVAPSFNTHPVYATDNTGKQVPVVTGHFGNRYVGEVNLTIDDNTGLVTGVGTTKMIRVSGNTAGFQPPGNPLPPFVPLDADAVVGDATINAAVVAPLQTYINVLNAQIIGTTATKLNGPTHVACTGATPPPPCPKYIAGVRNADTGLGNLVADAMRFAGKAEVAIQNGGGIRTNIAGPGNVSVGDTFNVLPFTNLVKRAPVMNATQLKDLLEHSVAASTPTGVAQGRFAQVSGIKVTYDTTKTARTALGTGERIRRIVLDDGTVLVDNAIIINPARTFSFATIDFTANGGDGYPFAANAVAFENSLFTITYQQALADFISTPKANGGLQRANAADGDEITSNMYGLENAFDMHGRLVDAAVAVAVPGVPKLGTASRDTLIGTAGDDTITGGAGPDTLTGGAGGDKFVYGSLRDAGDVITDFTPYADTIELKVLLASVGCDVATSCEPVADGYIKVVDVIGGASLQIDPDGNGPAAARPLVTLKGLTAKQIVPGRDLGL